LGISAGTRAVVFVAGLALSACASNPARSSETVPLEIPKPPPRVAMDPVPAVIAEPPPVAPERPAATPASRPAGTPASPPAAAVTPPAAQPPPPITPPEQPRVGPPPELRPAGPAGRTPTAAQVRDRLVRTKQKLDSLDRGRLNAGKRTDYDSARRFLSQAEAAVKDNNLLLAESSVEKAETLADGLK
jgi:hypothetical protein